MKIIFFPLCAQYGQLHTNHNAMPFHDVHCVVATAKRGKRFGLTRIRMRNTDYTSKRAL